MTREMLQALADSVTDKSPHNFLGRADKESGKDAQQYGEHAGMRFFERPIFSITSADNPGFEEIRRPGVVGPHHKLPSDWLPDAKSVISFFLPYEKATVDSNKADPIEPSMQWLYTRIEGQQLLIDLGAKICDALHSKGFNAVTPFTEPAHIVRVGMDATPETGDVPRFSTNWSERHVAVVSGLGTFGLSTCFISRVGCAGRIVSIVTDWEATPDVPDYDDWLGYCNRCGACIRRCPAEAHYPDRAEKDHDKCSALIRQTCGKYMPRYGCGKCQSGLPCDYRAMNK